MTSLRERCLLLTCKWNPSARVHFAVEQRHLHPRAPLALTKRNAVHLLRMSRRTCLALLVASLSCPAPSFPFLAADSGRSTVS